MSGRRPGGGRSSARDERFHDAGPGARDIAPVVATAAHSEYAAVAELVGNAADRGGRARVRCFAVRQVRNRVALQAVRSALQQDELGTGGTQVLLDTRPGRGKVRVARTGR